jgi:hypothetical protein
MKFLTTLLLLLVVPLPLLAQHIDASGIADGSYPYVVTIKGGKFVSMVPETVITLSTQPVPTPGPDPVPDPVLTVKATVIRDLALKATADPKRAETAVMLSLMYTEISKMVGTGQIPLDKVGEALRLGTEQVLVAQASPADAWKATRDRISTYLIVSLQEGRDPTATLIKEVAAGLEASVPKFQAGDPKAIDREKLKQLILQLLPIILALLLG